MAAPGLDALRAELRRQEEGHRKTHKTLPFDVSALDSALPERGLALGAVHEIVGGANGAVHASAATLFAAGILARLPGRILWCHRQRDLFAPALAEVGLALERVIFVEPGDDKQLLACMEEGLRHGSVTGVVGEISKLSLTASRRLQLAAETSGTLGLLIRRWASSRADASADTATSARTRWQITAQPSSILPVAGLSRGRWHIELMRCRGGERAAFDVEVCDEAGYLTLSTQLGDRPAAAAYGPARAVH